MSKHKAVDELQHPAESAEEVRTPLDEFKDEIRKWETEHLAVIDPKLANVEFGMISQLVREIGDRCNRRLVAASQGKCGAPGCGKPLGGRPYNQVSVFNMQTGKYDEMYSCSERCNVKLIDLQHKSAITQQTSSQA